jgi:4-hydroxy-3-methylbut-2-enyl diphosphate reductase
LKIIKAESAGFCFGVERAVSIAMNASHTSITPVVTLGELIHNRSVIEELEANGVGWVESVDDVESGTVIIRSHGVSKNIYELIDSKKLKMIDATCTYVKSIQNKVENYHKKGYTIIIVGDKKHPEVIGVNGWCEDSAVIITDKEEASEIETNSPVCIVAQTTIIKSFFDEVCDIVRLKYPNVLVFNTICSATTKRQLEAEQIASSADAMIVVGGKSSSNTKKLVEICYRKCNKVYHIESAADIRAEHFSGCETVGITAGASTPAKLILEVLKKMDNTMENFEKSIDNYRQIKTGDIVSGEIISVNDNEVYVNIGYKSDGIIKKDNFSLDLYNVDLPSIAAIGDTIEAMVVDMNDGTGNVELSKIKVDEIEAYKEAEVKFENKETVKGRVSKIVKGGVIVDLGFGKAFMPGNQYALKYTEDLNVLKGKDVEGRIIEFDKEKNKIIFSRRVILQEEKEAARAAREKLKNEAISALEIGQVLSAPVKNITDFGIFLDLNGVDGFVHVSDLSWRRISNPKNFCSVGDVIEAKIIELDRESYKIKLSVKGMTQEPWQQFLDNYKVGDKVDVTIKSLVKFGAFAEILPGVEGLIHISNLSHSKVASAESVLSVGEQTQVKIIDIDTEKRKIGLSLKDMTVAPKRQIESDKMYYREDSKVTMEDLFKRYLDQ